MPESKLWYCSPMDKNWWHPLAGMAFAALVIAVGVLAVLS